jgi:hypothetical protein
MCDLKQLYVTATSEPDQYAIDNYSGHQFSDGELMPVEEYFRVSGYFGSYGPHMFAAAPKLLEACKMIDALDQNDSATEWNAALKAIAAAIAAANGESQR